MYTNKFSEHMFMRGDTMTEREIPLERKLKILADAAKYDVACTSSGSSRRGKKGHLGNTVSRGCGYLSYIFFRWTVCFSFEDSF